MSMYDGAGDGPARAARRLVSFDQHAHRISAAQAEGCDAAFGAGALHLMEQRREDACAAAADRVAQRDAAAADVELFFGDSQLRDVRQNLCRERLVQFEEIDIL